MRIIVCLAVIFALTACARDEIDPTADWTVEQLYNEARSELAKENYLTAIEYYETLESRYPFGNYATQAQIDVAYAYFKFGEPDSAITAIDRFIKLHPRHESVDYAYYLKGLVNFERGGTVLDNVVERDMSAFDRNLLVTAYNDFKLMVQRFPESRYTPDATRRMIFLRDELARADYRIADHYARREAWVAVANRTRQILEDYQGSSVIRRTLELQLRAYEQLGLDELARDTRRIIDLNYNRGS